MLEEDDGVTIRAGILGTGSALPDQILTNADLEKMVETDDEWITSRTGIKERRIAPEGTTTSDYATLAAERALADAGMAASELDFIICATVTPDMMFPATACLVQDRIGATHAGAMDLSAACTGFLYGVATAATMVESGRFRRVLVIGADLQYMSLINK
ncbi:MAG: hypothetical protein K6T63_05820, partial [Alicyclobacillus herbarius]|nr:hypothetical protein [Alicyclobacillus herbarius]